MTTVRIDTLGRLDDERRAQRELIDKLNAQAETNWHEPSWRREMAAEMFNTIWRGFDSENLLDRMIQVERVGKNDRVFIKEVRGLRVFWVSRGGQIDASTLRRNIVELPRDMCGWHVYELDDRLETNFAETQQEVVDAAIQQMDAEVNLFLLRLVQSAVPFGGAGYNHGNGLPLNTLKRMIREVQDTTGMEVSVIGRSPMLGQVWDAIEGSGLFVPERNTELFDNGVLGKYHGANLIQLKNYLNDLDQPTFPANELFVLAQDAGKFAFFGGLKGEEWSEQGGFYWHSQGSREVGGLLARADRVRRFVDDTISPSQGAHAGI